MFPKWVSPLSNYFVPPLVFWPTSLNTTRLELVTLALDWGDGPAPDLWTVSDPNEQNGRQMSPIIIEDSQFSEAIQRSMKSRAFRSLPLSNQEARIYYFHQHCDAIIGANRVPVELRVDPVIDPGWVWPHDPRRVRT